jgi:predicted secreted protein
MDRQATRRQFLAAAAGTAVALAVRPARATPETMKSAIRQIVGEAAMKSGRIKLDLPPLVENGNTVAMAVSVDSPMTAKDYVKAIHVVTEKNPQPNVISAGQSSTLIWEVQNADAVQISSIGNVPLSGTAPVSPTQTTTYKLTATRGGNSQSATGYVFQADYVQSGGRPVYDSAGIPIPNFVPGQSRLQNWISTVGAVININTTSFFLQDHWVVTPRLSVDLGTRF